VNDYKQQKSVASMNGSQSKSWKTWLQK